MNVKLLRKVKKHILEEPKRLFMWDWIVRKRDEDHRLWYGVNDEKSRAFAKCDTAACICGWAILLSGNKEPERESMWKLGAKLLGLNEQDSNRLFAPGMWPDQFRRGYRDDGKPETAKVAAARIEHFIKTKGAE